MKFIGMILAVAIAGLAQSAKATPFPFPSSPSIFVYDSGTGGSDFIPIVSGQAVYNSSVGNYSTVISVGTTVAAGSYPYIDLNTHVVQLTPGTAGSLYIFYSDVGFGSTAGGYSLTAAIGSGSMEMYAYLSAANTLFGMDTSLGGSANVTSFFSMTGSIDAAAPYSLTIEQIFTGNASSAITDLKVPDGGTTLMLLGGALVCIGLIRRKLVA